MKKKKEVQYAFCFRRWSRKPYAAFSSMHKAFKLGVLCFTISIISKGGQTAIAQADSLKKDTTTILDESVVTGIRTDKMPNVVRVAATLTEERVNSLPAQGVNDLLRYLPSVDLRQRGPAGTQADVSVRGTTFDQTQVLLNGVNFSDPQTGHYSLDLPLDVSAVSRIEVLQGPGAAGTPGGSLNMVTTVKPDNALQINLTGGQFGYLNAGATANLHLSNLQTLTAVSHQRSDGYTSNTDFSTTNAYSLLRYAGQTVGTFEAQLGYQQKSYGAHGFYSFKYPDQLENTRLFLGSIRWQKQLGSANLWALAYHRQHFDRFELFRFEPADWYTGHSYHRALSSGSELGATYTSLLGTTTLSAEVRNDQIYSTVLGEKMDNPKPVPFEDGKEYTHEAGRSMLRAMLSHSYTLSRFTFSGGTMLYHTNMLGAKLHLSADIRMQLNPYSLIYLAASQALRQPTFTDLYYKDATHIPNPDLKPEEATIYELGSRYRYKTVQAGTAVFYRDSKNVIDWVYVEGEEKSKSMNFGRLNALGAEMSLVWSPSAVRPSFIIQHIEISYSFVSLSKNNTAHSTSYALDQLRHKLSLNVCHLLGVQQLKAQWQLSYLDRAGSYVSSTGSVKPYDPALLVNLRLLWERKQYRLFAEAINLFGVTYFDYGGIEQPKSWFTIGVNISLL